MYARPGSGSGSVSTHGAVCLEGAMVYGLSHLDNRAAASAGSAAGVCAGGTGVGMEADTQSLLITGHEGLCRVEEAAGPGHRTVILAG